MELPTYVRIPKNMKIQSRADMELAIASGLCGRAGSLLTTPPRMVSSASLVDNHLYKRAVKRSTRRLVNDLAAYAW
jgi:hypothetical protein